MITVSLCMIVKNEEETIARCLDAVKNLVDEIIIVDTGSSDRTKEIISQYTDRIIDFIGLMTSPQHVIMLLVTLQWTTFFG